MCIYIYSYTHIYINAEKYLESKGNTSKVV